METHVYINGREACSKAADGKSTAAFPDPCWSPPTPPAGPVVVPYPNTAKACNLANGTSSVFICNSMVAQKDRSYFSTSEGDDSATQGLQKGTVSHVIKGKAFFKSWSGNVKFEGLEVPRHQDMMTHNHGSSPNTPPHIYIDSKAAKNECKKNIDRMKKACKHDPKQKSMLERVLGKDKYKKLEPLLKKKSGDKSAEWMSHCDGMWVGPDALSKDVPDLQEKLSELSDGINKALNTEIDAAIDTVKSAMLDRAIDKAGDIAIKKGRNAAIRHTAALGGAAVGGVGAVATEAVATVWTIGDTVVGVAEGGYEAYKAYDVLSSAKDELKKLPGELQKMADDAVKEPAKAMTNMMTVLSRLNACTRAKKCILVPYKETTGPAKFKGDGCCPGQTGHHLLPGAMFYDNTNCPNYKHGEAPTICVEGSSNRSDWGSHGQLHRKLKDSIDNYKKPGWFKFGDRNKISYEDARKMAITSVMTTFPESMCSPKCLQAQLDKHYEKMCKPKILNANSGMGGPNQSRPFSSSNKPSSDSTIDVD